MRVCGKRNRLKSFLPLGIIVPFVFILKIKTNDSTIPSRGKSTLVIKHSCPKMSDYLFVCWRKPNKFSKASIQNFTTLRTSRFAKILVNQAKNYSNDKNNFLKKFMATIMFLQLFFYKLWQIRNYLFNVTLKDQAVFVYSSIMKPAIVWNPKCEKEKFFRKVYFFALTNIAAKWRSWPNLRS